MSPPPLDEWDRRTRGLALAGQDDDLLVELARRYLVDRGDQALGLAPTKLLPPRKAHAWILFWTAARRVDDAIENGIRPAQEWRDSLDAGRAVTLAERCLQAFLHHAEGAGTRDELKALLRRGLEGLEREASFDQPQPLADYLDLIHDKSATAMLILDRLLFPGESEAVLRRHAEAFAATTQMGDDCRDVERDLGAGRCFVTLEELDGAPSLARFVRSNGFARQRAGMCRLLLDRADDAAARFRIEDHVTLAGRLSDLWLHAIQSGQVKPTRRPLQLPARPPRRDGASLALPRSIQSALSKRFPAR